MTERAAKALSDTVTPVGLVAVCTVPDVGLADVIADGPRLVAVAVGISEPGNAGTLIRIADAMGADAVVLAGHSVDPYNGKCLRASAGSIFSLPVVSGPGCRRRRWRRCATPDCRCWPPPSTARSVSTTPSWPGRRRGCSGPSPTVCHANWRPWPTHRVRIPMPGSAESLNVASAAAICLYQSARAHRR